jgi:glucose-1-phosphate adenylyltransferase
MPLTRDRAKPAVPFGGRYRLIDFVLSNFVNSGFYQIKVLTQYKASSLISHITRGWQLAPMLGQYVEAVPAQMRVSRDWFKGSADAVFQNLNLINDARPEVVAVFGADHIYKMDVSAMVDEHLANKADLTVAAIPVTVEQGRSFGIIQVDADWRMVDFIEKPEHPPEIPGRPGWCLASMGNYLFRTDALVDEIVRDSTRKESVHDFGKDIITEMVRRGLTAYAYDFTRNEHPGMEPKERGYWRDVGSIDNLWEASMDLIAVTPVFNLYNREWPIRTIEHLLPPAKFVFDYPGAKRHGIATDSLVAPGCIISGGRAARSVIAAAVNVHSWADIQESVIGQGCEIGRRVMIKKAILDKFVTVEEGVRIGYDHEHDRARGFHVSPGGVVTVPKGTHVKA